MAEKTYTEAEIKKIINKATQMQNEDFKSDLESSRGFTLSELEKLGADVGLKKEYLYATATEYDHENGKGFSDVNATHIFEEREVQCEINANSWDDICSELRHYFGTKYGKIEEDPKRLEWRHMSIGGIETMVNVSSGNNNTILRISQRVGLASSYTEGALYGFVLTCIGVFIASEGFELGSFALLSTSVTLFILFSVIVFALDVAWRKKKHKDLQKLSGKLAKVLYRNQNRGKNKKLKLETDIAERNSNKDFSNILFDESTENEIDSMKISEKKANQIEFPNLNTTTATRT